MSGGGTTKQRPLLEDPGARWWASSDRKDWCTPDEELALVRQLSPRSGVFAIGLDPCSNPSSRVGARVDCQLERGQNGLNRTWRGHGLVFVNPPYGRNEVDLFTAHAAKEFAPRPLDSDECLLLLPANTDVKWYHRDCVVADALCLREGRIAFRLPDGEAKGDSTVGNLWVYWGERPDRFLEVFGPSGDARLTTAGFRRLAARGAAERELAIALLEQGAGKGTP